MNSRNHSPQLGNNQGKNLIFLMVLRLKDRVRPRNLARPFTRLLKLSAGEKGDGNDGQAHGLSDRMDSLCWAGWIRRERRCAARAASQALCLTRKNCRVLPCPPCVQPRVRDRSCLWSVRRGWLAHQAKSAGVLPMWLRRVELNDARRKQKTPATLLLLGSDLVAWGGIEPPTRGFSIRCSTN